MRRRGVAPMFKEVFSMAWPVTRGFEELGKLRVGHRRQFHCIRLERDFAFESQWFVQRGKFSGEVGMERIVETAFANAEHRSEATTHRRNCDHVIRERVLGALARRLWGLERSVQN